MPIDVTQNDAEYVKVTTYSLNGTLPIFPFSGLQRIDKTIEKLYN